MLCNFKKPEILSEGKGSWSVREQRLNISPKQKMIVKILGFIDLLIVPIIFLSPHIPQKVVFYGAGYLITKGAFFGMAGDIASYIDILCGLYIILLGFGISWTFLNVIVIIYLMQKAILSFF